MGNSQENLEKAFYSDGYKLAMNAVEDNLNQENLFIALNEMYSAIDALTDSLLEFAHKQGKTVDCKKGCEWCCHQPVYALDYELDYLKQYIGSNLNSAEQRRIRLNAIRKNEKISGLDQVQMQKTRFPCPLLHDGACCAYDVRPMACRIYVSSDEGTCRSFFENPGDKSKYPSLLDLPLRLGRMMNEGFKAALKTNGIVSKEYRIEEKIG